MSVVAEKLGFEADTADEALELGGPVEPDSMAELPS
jgi:hypothetical protein